MPGGEYSARAREKTPLIDMLKAACTSLPQRPGADGRFHAADPFELARLWRPS